MQKQAELIQQKHSNSYTSLVKAGMVFFSTTLTSYFLQSSQSLLLPVVQAQLGSGPSRIGTEFRINTATAWDHVFLKNLTNNRFIVTYRSSLDGDGSGIAAQLFDGTGNKLGFEFVVNTYIIHDQWDSSVASFMDGKFVVTWTSGDYGNFNYTQDGSGAGCYGQLFDSSAVKLGSEFQINTYIINDQELTSVEVFTNSSFITVWSSYDQTGDLRWHLFGQIFQIINNTAVKQVTEFQIDSTGNDGALLSSIVLLDNSNVFLAYECLLGICGQVLSQVGARIGNELVLNRFTVPDNYWPSVALQSSSAGTLLVTWGEWQTSANVGNVSSYYQFLDPTATQLTFSSEQLVNPILIGANTGPWVSSFGRGGFIVAWENGNSNVTLDGSGYGIFAQLFNNLGTRIGSEFQVNTYFINDQRKPKVAVLSNQNFVVAWQGPCTQGGSICGQLFYGSLVISNSYQTIYFVEDSIGTNLVPISVSSPSQVVDVTMTLSDPSAGNLTSSVSGNVTSSYNIVTGVWQAAGDIPGVNLLLQQLVFNAKQYYRQNFTISLLVSDGLSQPQNGVISMIVLPVNHSPFLVNPIPLETVILNQPFIFNISSRMFRDPDGDPMTYSAKFADGSFLPSWISFDPNTLIFTGTSLVLGTNQLMVIATDPFSAFGSAYFNLTTISNNVIPKISTATDNTAAMVGATTSSAVALGGLIAFGLWYRKRSLDANTRKQHRFADHIRAALKLKGIDNFESEKGQRYLAVIQKLENEFSIKGGMTLSRMSDKELKDIAQQVSISARNKITPSTRCGYSIINPEDIDDSKISTIIQDVLRMRVGQDDTNIKMASL